jgi:hypothetical protein
LTAWWPGSMASQEEKLRGRDLRCWPVRDFANKVRRFFLTRELRWLHKILGTPVSGFYTRMGDTLSGRKPLIALRSPRSRCSADFANKIEYGWYPCQCARSQRCTCAMARHPASTTISKPAISDLTGRKLRKLPATWHLFTRIPKQAHFAPISGCA